MIYHITTPQYFSKFGDNTPYEAESLSSEGFIHCSTISQLKASAERFYSMVPEIVILTIDEQKLTSKLRYELASIGAEFPHIYGAINREAIILIAKYRNNGGTFEIAYDGILLH